MNLCTARFVGSDCFGSANFACDWRLGSAHRSHKLNRFPLEVPQLRLENRPEVLDISSSELFFLNASCGREARGLVRAVQPFTSGSDSQMTLNTSDWST